MTTSGGGPEPAVGADFAGFRIQAVIGRGGMGAVYRARDLRLDHERALKILEPRLARDRTFRERFQRESQLAAAIEHAAVVPVYQAGEEDERLFIVMRLVRGPDLHRLVTTDGPLEPRRAARFITAVAGALDAAHRRGTIHRDVKPANILVELGEEGERVFLSDFGISRPAQSSAPLTSTGELLGTVDYIAPEQIEGKPADARSDVYALGCVVCFLLTGEPPFRRETDLATLYAHGHAERPKPSLLEPGLPAGIDAVVARATAVNPDHRYQSAGELAEDLSRAVRGSPAEAPTEALPTDTETPRRRGRIWAIAAAIAAVLAAAVIAIVLLGGDGDDAGAPDGAASTPSNVVLLDGPVDSIVVGKVNVLAAAQEASRIYAISPESTTVKRNFGVPAPSAVTVGFGSVWVASASDDALFRFRATDIDTPVLTEVGDRPSALAVSGRFLWVANKGDGTVSRVDGYAAPGKANNMTVVLRDAPEAIAAGEDAIWVASPEAGSIARIFPRGKEPAGDPVKIGERPTDLALGEGALWVVDGAAGTLSKLSPDDGSQLREPVELGLSPVAVAVGLGSVWVADSAEDEVIEVDPATGRELETFAVGDRPTALSVGADAVWVANTGGQNVSRIEP